jgi:hypothetical protein
MPFFWTFSRFQLKISVEQLENNSCQYLHVFSEIIKEEIARFVDICEIDDLSLYEHSFTSTYRPSAAIYIHVTVDINDI